METKGFATIQSSVVLYGVFKGLGKSVDLIGPADLQAVQKVDHETHSLQSHMELILLGRLRQ